MVTFPLRTITGPRKLEDAWDIAIGHKLTEQTAQKRELCKHMEIEITGTEKKVFSFTDSIVVEGQKIVNKSAITKIETGLFKMYP